MKILGLNINSLYKSFHVLFTCSWFGSVLAVILIYLLTPIDSSKTVLINNAELIEKIDWFIIIPSSLFCYLSGLVISWKTNWDFFRYKWILYKLILGTGLILFGVCFFGPWIMDSSNTSDLNDLEMIQCKLGVSMIVQAIIIVVTIFISTTKPWGKLNLK